MFNLARKCRRVVTQTSLSEVHNRFYVVYSSFLRRNDRTAKYNLSSRQFYFLCNRRPGASVNHTSAFSQAADTSSLQDESHKLMAVFPDIVRELTENGCHTDIPEANKWFAEVLQYNVPFGRKVRALSLVYSYKQLVPPDQQTPESLRLAYIMAWCVEMLQGFYLVEDDIMDNGERRRGQQCWYRRNNLGMAAINDGLLLESGVYLLLQRHFHDKPYYVDLVETFMQVTHQSFLGQLLDLHSFQKDGRPRLEHFTMDRYNTLVKYKTGYYTYVLPVALSMHMTGFKDPQLFQQAEKILLEIGHLYQAQDDYLDCYGNNEAIGKIGAGDIGNGKCTWPSVVALQKASPEQRLILEENFGVKDPDRVAVVKRLYEELGLPALYACYEEEMYERISMHIQQLPSDLPHAIFHEFLNRTYRRQL